MADLSLRAFAKLLKVSDMAVRKAIASGRLKKSVGANGKGQPVIKNSALAIKEWAANAAKVGKGAGMVSLADVQRRVGIERERGLKLANDKEAKLLLSKVDEARVDFQAARVVRDQVLNIPARVSAELAAESDQAKVFIRLDTEIRLALNSIADQLEKMA